RVPNSLFVRRWRAINGNKDWQAKIRQEGISHVIKTDAKNSLLPVYSRVAGDIPLDELPVVEAGSNKYSVIQFEIEVLTEGNVDLLFNSAEGITAWSGQEALVLTDKGTVTQMPK